MANDDKNGEGRGDTAPDGLDARAIERAYVRGSAGNRRVGAALDKIARTVEREPDAVARALRRWMDQG